MNTSSHNDHQNTHSTHAKPSGMFDKTLLKPALISTFKKLNPRIQWGNPVMFVVYIGSLLTTVLAIQALLAPNGKLEGGESFGFIFAITVWLWFTVLFANFAEAIAEGRSKAQAASRKFA